MYNDLFNAADYLYCFSGVEAILHYSLGAASLSTSAQMVASLGAVASVACGTNNPSLYYSVPITCSEPNKWVLDPNFCAGTGKEKTLDQPTHVNT